MSPVYGRDQNERESSVSQEPKKFLRKGDKSRKVYDPKQAIAQGRSRQRNLSVNSSKERIESQIPLQNQKESFDPESTLKNAVQACQIEPKINN